MDKEAQTLQQLKELPLPQPVPYVPQTIGWVILAGLVLVALAWLGWRSWRHWKANAYRRLALAELRAIEADLAIPARRTAALALLPELLKRTALAALPREQVAELSGPAWLAFLDRSAPATAAVGDMGPMLSQIAYGRPVNLATLPMERCRALAEWARRWIEQHHV